MAPRRGSREEAGRTDCDNLRMWLITHQPPTIRHDDFFTMFPGLVSHEEVPFSLPLPLALSAKITLFWKQIVLFLLQNAAGSRELLSPPTAFKSVLGM